MGKQREPIELIKAKGKKHLTKQEIADREKQEIKVPFKNIIAPSNLTAQQKKKFNKIADMLSSLHLMTELDVNCLARFVINQDLYDAYSKRLNELITSDADIQDIKLIQDLQSKVHSQIVKDEKACGLNIASRMSMSAPIPKEEPKVVNKFSKFEKR